jgi:dolichol-phosphate mannosyltransferase
MSRKIFQHFLKMVSVGSTGMVLQFLIYNLLRTYLSPVWATQIAVTAAIVNNFYWHGRVTFAKEGFAFNRLWNREGGLFVGYSILMILLQGQWLLWTVELFKAGPLFENALIFIGMIWGAVLNFIFYRYVVWR